MCVCERPGQGRVGWVEEWCAAPARRPRGPHVCLLRCGVGAWHCYQCTYGPPKLTGSLRPWMVILTGVGVLVVAAMLPAPRVLPRCSTGWGRNRLRLAATRGAILAADPCRAALPRLEAMFRLVGPLLMSCEAGFLPNRRSSTGRMDVATRFHKHTAGGTPLCNAPDPSIEKGPSINDLCWFRHRPPDRADRCCIGFKLKLKRISCIPGLSGGPERAIPDAHDLRGSKKRKWMPSCAPSDLLVGLLALLMSEQAVCSLLSCQLTIKPRFRLCVSFQALQGCTHTHSRMMRP